MWFVMTLGKKIAVTRKLRGLTQRELAALIHIDAAMVTRWEQDKAQPKSSTLQKLSEVLEVPVEELLNSNEVEFSKKLFTKIDNQELVELLGQVSELGPEEQEALRLVLDCMLTKRRLQSLVATKKSA